MSEISIPRLPSAERWTEVSVVSGDPQNQLLLRNLIGFANLLWRGSDRLASNSVEPYGYFYPYIILVALLGLWMLIRQRTSENTPARCLLVAWFAAAVVIGIMQHPVNLNRINLIFIPLILFIAAVLAWLPEEPRAPAVPEAKALSFSPFLPLVLSLDAPGPVSGSDLWPEEPVLAAVVVLVAALSARSAASTWATDPVRDFLVWVE